MSNAKRLEDCIKRAYEIIGRATPLKMDCGRLCGAACCKDSAVGAGMANAAGAAADVDADVDADAEAGADADAVADVDADYNSNANSGTEVDVDTNTKTVADAVVDIIAGTGAGADTDYNSNADADYNSNADADYNSNAETDYNSNADADTDAKICALVSSSETFEGVKYTIGHPDATGMILFPGEVGLLSHTQGFRLFRIMSMGIPVWFVVCEGICDRRKRPLACRIFPLAPHIDEIQPTTIPAPAPAPATEPGLIITALPDPRATSVCPLADGENLDPAFRRAVTKAFRYLAQEPAILEYMKLLSADMADMRRFIRSIKKGDRQKMR